MKFPRLLWIWRLTRADRPNELKTWQSIAKKVRLFASHRYIRGEGLEIGALNHPLPTFHGAKVRYVDQLPVSKLRETYPELAADSLVEVNEIAEAETLASIPNESCDFVIANHVLEHTRNPLRAIDTMFRVLRWNGILYLAIPDKRFTFDRDRPVTTYDHLKRDYLESPEWSETAHYTEWIRCVGKETDEARLKQRIETIQASGDNIHFHVWTQREMLQLILDLRRDLGLPFEIEMITKAGVEVVIVLRKIDLG
jgi:SAM-dependent methyltransferase